MKALREEVNLHRFFEGVRTAGKRLLLLDYDGTLAPFRMERDKAAPYAGVRELLTGILKDKSTQIVLVTGRKVSDLISLLGFERLPEIWGSHGRERLTLAGAYQMAPVDPDAENGLQEAEAWAKGADIAELCEKKPGCYALHTRSLGQDKAEEVRRRVSRRWSAIAEKTGLALNEFDGGIELRAPGPNKGDAVRMILSEVDEPVAAAYLGDDFTDEDAFTALKGRGLAVLVREEWRETAADLWIRPPEELLQFLQQWREAHRNRSHSP